MTYELVPDATPEIVKLNIDNRKAISDGLEANVANCPGYSLKKMQRGLLTDKFMGLTLIDAFERHCNNPYLGTTDYGDLYWQITRGSLKAAQSLEQAKTRVADAAEAYEGYFVGRSHPTLRKIGRRLLTVMQWDDYGNKDLTPERQLQEAQSGLAGYMADHSDVVSLASEIEM
jgi:hypothetical protein